ncbi:hypothetical protein ACA910_002890 [Epithemia clementina (nom. ined.)]
MMTISSSTIICSACYSLLFLSYDWVTFCNAKKESVLRRGKQQQSPVFFEIIEDDKNNNNEEMAAFWDRFLRTSSVSSMMSLFPPTTNSPTIAPQSSSPVTQEPSSGVPVRSFSRSPSLLPTQAPSPPGNVPITPSPSSAVPTTLSPTTILPTSLEMTSIPTGPMPTSQPSLLPTQAPSNAVPTSLSPTTNQPTSLEMTSIPTGPMPTSQPSLLPTQAPSSAVPTSLSPTTNQPTSLEMTSIPTGPMPTSQQPSSTEAPSAATSTSLTTLEPTSLSPTVSMQPSGPGFQLCSGNIALNVTIGPRSNPGGGFVNVPTAQSLQNVVDCLDITQGEVHTQTSHVWWNPGPLELQFSFEQEYRLRNVYFWNYYGETYDVDQIDFEFFNSQGELVLNYTAFPRLGENANGSNGDSIVAETIDLPMAVDASRVNSILTSTNGQLDFQNFVFLAAN